MTVRACLLESAMISGLEWSCWGTDPEVEPVWWVCCILV